jgi:hypothetical protein
MSDKPTPAPKPAPEQSPLERTADLMRRVLQAKKPSPKPKKRRRNP